MSDTNIKVTISPERNIVVKLDFGGYNDHGKLPGLSDDDHPQYVKHSLATAVNDFLVASGVGVFIKKTLAEVKTILGLGSAAYTESSTYAPAAKGVTNGDSHDHSGGDGAQIAYSSLSGTPTIPDELADLSDDSTHRTVTDTEKSTWNGKTDLATVKADTDIADALSKKHASGSDAETTTTIGTLINGADAKATPVDTDMVGLMDSGASNILKKLSWANIKATLRADFVPYSGATSDVSLGSNKILFGTSGAEDVNLYRSSANWLKTDDNLYVGGGVLNIGSAVAFQATDVSYVNGGNFGIGTVAPAYKLDIKTTDGTYHIALGDSTAGGWVAIAPDGTNGNIVRFGGTGANANILRFLGSSDTERVRIDNSGYVGIGTTSPSNKLHIEGTSAGSTFSGLRILNAGTTVNTASQIIFTNKTASGANTSATITAIAEEAVLGYTALVFGNSARTSETMRITSGGKVGIGTTSPNRKLELQITERITAYSADDLTTWSDTLIKNPTETVGAGTGIAFMVDSSYHVNGASGIGVVKVDAGYATDMVFITRGIGVASSEKMRITSAGAVLIGDTTNANVSQGLTINQGANDDQILALKSSDVSHGFTGECEADTYGAFAKSSATAGGLRIYGYNEGSASGALILNGALGSADPDDSYAAVLIQGDKLNGTVRGALGASETVLLVRNYSTTLLTILGSGNVGIGTTSPNSKLQISSGNLEVDNAYGITSVGGIKYTADSDNNAPSAGLLHQFLTNTTTVAMVIQKNGNIGIGTTSPGVAGNGSSALSGAILDVTSASSYGRLLARGSAGARLELIDSGGGENDKHLSLLVDGGIGWFKSLDDAGSGTVKDNILVMDLGSGGIGIGTTTIEADSTYTLNIANGTAPDNHVDNQIIIYSTDSSDSAATLGLFLEQDVEDVGTFTPTKKIKIKINGIEYWIQLDPVA